MRHRTRLIGAALLTFSGMALADTTIKMDQTGASADTSVTYINEDMMRVDTGHDGTYMLFDSNTNTMTIVQPDDRSYMVIDQARVESMGNMMEQARAQMEAQLAKLPPAQRERMREMMGERFGAIMGGEPKAEPEVVRTGEEKTVNGYSCEVVEVRAEGTVNGSFCLASRSELGIPEADYQTMRDMMAFSKSMAEQFAQFDNMGLPTALMELEGVPVETHSTIAGMQVDSSLNSVSTGPLADNLFTIPEDYQEQQMPQMPAG